MINSVCSSFARTGGFRVSVGNGGFSGSGDGELHVTRTIVARWLASGRRLLNFIVILTFLG